jgi:hypothetical protein
MGTSSANNRPRITASWCYAHALAEDWIKAAEGIAYREQPCRERLQALEMPPCAARQLVADDISQRSGVPDRVIDGRGAQALDEIHESRAVARRHIAMIASDGKQPSLFLDRKQERSAAAGGCGWQDDIAQPVGIVIDWSLDGGARVSLINADLGFLRLLQGKLFEQLQRQAAAAGGFNH